MAKWRKRVANLGLDPQKELILCGIYYLFAVAVGLFAAFGFSPMWGLGSLAGGGIIVTLYISFRYQTLEEAQNAARIEAFIDAFDILKIFLFNGLNVYRSLEATIKYVKPALREPLLRLIEDIDGDKSLQPYISFARYFSTNIIEQLLVALYQYDTEGGSVRHIEGFEYMFAQFRTEQKRDQTRRYEERLDAMNMWPLLGAGIIAVNLLIGVVEIIMRAISEL